MRVRPEPTAAAGPSTVASWSCILRQGYPRETCYESQPRGAADIMETGDRVDRIKEGCEADLVILDADPLAHVRAVERVHAVINNGRLADVALIRFN